MALDGVEIIVNGSGSYMELRKAFVAVELIRYAFVVFVIYMPIYRSIECKS